MGTIPILFIAIEAIIGLTILVAIIVLAIRRYEEKQGEDFSRDN